MKSNTSVFKNRFGLFFRHHHVKFLLPMVLAAGLFVIVAEMTEEVEAEAAGSAFEVSETHFRFSCESADGKLRLQTDLVSSSASPKRADEVEISEFRADHRQLHVSGHLRRLEFKAAMDADVWMLKGVTGSGLYSFELAVPKEMIQSYSTLNKNKNSLQTLSAFVESVNSDQDVYPYRWSLNCRPTNTFSSSSSSSSTLGSSSLGSSARASLSPLFISGASRVAMKTTKRKR